jgi:hypothetical protein
MTNNNNSPFALIPEKVRGAISPPGPGIIFPDVVIK